METKSRSTAASGAPVAESEAVLVLNLNFLSSLIVVLS